MVGPTNGHRELVGRLRLEPQRSSSTDAGVTRLNGRLDLVTGNPLGFRTAACGANFGAGGWSNPRRGGSHPPDMLFERSFLLRVDCRRALET